MQKALPSTSLESAVRGALGLTQEQLARYLGVTRGQVAHAEAGRRVLRGEASRRLFLLADLLPPPLGNGPPEPAPEAPAAPGPLDPHPLRRRQRRCAWQAANRRLELEQLAGRARHAHRWQQVLPQLRAALPTDPTDAEGLRTRRWLDARAAEAQEELDAASATAHVLLHLRIEHLEAEAAQLARLLAAPGAP